MSRKQKQSPRVTIEEHVSVPEPDSIGAYDGANEIYIEGGGDPPPSPPHHCESGVVESNVKVLAEAPAMATASLYQSLAHSTGLSFEGSVSSQRRSTTIGQTAATVGVNQLLTLPTAETAVAASKISRSDLAEILASLSQATSADVEDD